MYFLQGKKTFFTFAVRKIEKLWNKTKYNSYYTICPARTAKCRW